MISLAIELESFKLNFSDMLKVAVQLGQIKEAAVFKSCIAQLEVQLNELRHRKHWSSVHRRSSPTVAESEEKGVGVAIVAVRHPVDGLAQVPVGRKT
jgi:hypothetical protein